MSTHGRGPSITADLQERQRIRRGQLLAAGITLLGAPQRSSVTVRATCRLAGLTERYFYESFHDRDEFVRAVYQEVGARAHATLADVVARGGPASAMAQAAVEAFVHLVVDDPTPGRVLLIAPQREPALAGHGMTLVPAFVALVHAQLPPDAPEDTRQMTAVALVGALTGLFVAHLEGTLAVTRERLVAHCVELTLATQRTAATPPA